MEFGHRRLPLFFGEFAFLRHAGGAGGDNAQQRDAHAHQGGDAPGFVGVAGQLAAEGGRDQRARGRAQSAADRRAQPHPQVTNHQSPGQSPEAPHRPEQVAPAERFPGDLVEDREHVGRDDRRQDPGRQQQARQPPDQPVALPRPLFDPLQREIEAGPGQPRQHVQTHAQKRVRVHRWSSRRRHTPCDALVVSVTRRVTIRPHTACAAYLIVAGWSPSPRNPSPRRSRRRPGARPASGNNNPTRRRPAAS